MSGALRVSVVIPAFGRVESLQRCLTALAAQDCPADEFEVIVVDDGSPEPLAPAVERIAGPLRVEVRRRARGGPAAARNEGARHASAPVIAFTDDDCEPTPRWLRRVVLTAGDRPDALVGGRVVNVLEQNRYSAASQQLVDFLYDWYAPERDGRFFTSNNLAVPRDAFLALGGFDESFPLAGGEDRELCARWERSGRPLVYDREAVVRHAHALTLGGFVGQHRNYGRGAYHFHRSRAAAGAVVHVEPPRFYANLVAAPLRRESSRAALVQSGLLTLAQAANAAGFVEEWLRAR